MWQGLWWNVVVPVSRAVAWIYRRVIVPTTLWIWASRRGIVQAWFLFGLCFLFVDFTPYWLAMASAFLESLLNAIAPRANSWQLFTTTPPPPPLPWHDILLAKLPATLYWYGFLVLPLFLLIRSRNVVDALAPFDPRIMENTVRLLRLRARAFRIWSGCAVVLIVGTLWVGVILFATGDTTVIENLPPKEPGKETYKIELVEDTNSLITSMARRVGAVLIVVFLVTVLVHMYRDNIKQATFYDRWADAFQLAGTNTDELRRYTDLFFLGSLELDKPPKSPVEQLAQALRGVQNQLGKLKG